jgi:hypothetical protein
VVNALKFVFKKRQTYFVSRPVNVNVLALSKLSSLKPKKMHFGRTAYHSKATERRLCETSYLLILAIAHEKDTPVNLEPYDTSTHTGRFLLFVLGL